jgi:small GTP-binding protein
MEPRPTIFLSGDSEEFTSFRDAVEIEIRKRGCFVENQASFANDYRTAEAMLRQKLSEADAVIHLVGYRYGAEPRERPADAPRRSYTQMEYYIARELGKPIYAFLSADESVRVPIPAIEEPEDAKRAYLQIAHREAVKESNYLNYSFKDKNELCRLMAEVDLFNGDIRIDISRIAQYAPANLIGRESEVALLDDAWQKIRRAISPRVRVISLVAPAGEGKSSLMATWAMQFVQRTWSGCDSAFAWSFSGEMATSSDLFFKEAISFFGEGADKEFAASNASVYEKGQRLARIISQRRCLLLLDGLESLQSTPTSPKRGNLNDAGLATLLRSLAADSRGLCVVTTRYSLPAIHSHWRSTFREVPLLGLPSADGVELLRSLGVNGTLDEFEKLVEDVNGHALTLTRIGTYLREAHGGDIGRRNMLPLEILPNQSLQTPNVSYIDELATADKKRFGELVRIARMEHGFTQADLARRAKIAEKTVSRVELGINTSSQTKARIISAVKSLLSQAVTEHASAESRPLNEAKLILLGNGMVGKTSLVKRLASSEFPREPYSTRLSLSQLQISIEGKSTSLNVWDFGGQEILHATHRFFLSSSAVYLVVLSGRQGTQDRDAEYWLTMVETYGDSCPTIVVLNQFDSFPFQINTATLKEKFPFIQAFVETSAATGQGVVDLRQEISSAVREVTKTAPVFPKKWIRIRQRLMGVQEDFISFTDYRRLCSELGEKDAAAQEALADVLHSLGIVVTFREQQEQAPLMVLNPGWVTDAVYRVLTSPQLIGQDGEFTRGDLASILPEEPAQVLPVIVGLMEKFELCFPYDDTKDRYLVPELLEHQQPFLTETFLPEECLCIRYDYSFLPPGLLPRFITRTHNMSFSFERWRTGVVLRSPGASALVRVDSDDRHVMVNSKGESKERLQLLTQIRKTFDQINAELRPLHVGQYIEVPGHAGLWIQRTDLEIYREQGDEQIKITFKGDLLSLSVDDLIRSFGLLDEPEPRSVEPARVDTEELSDSQAADQLEQAARNELQSGSYQLAWRSLEKAIQHDPKREQRVRAEFEFLFSSLTSEGEFKDDSPTAVSRLDWCRSVWEVLSERNYFLLTDLQPELSKPIVEKVATSQPEKAGPTIKAQSDNVERKGEVLEEAVARLFRSFFQIGDDHPWKIRQQKRGTQGGYDLSIEWSGKFEVTGNASVRCHIECKNYTNTITPHEVAEKLLFEPKRNPVIDHWILISPRSNPSNPLNEFLEKQREEGLPFEVQVWCPETGIDELFGLEPEVYDLFFEPGKGEDHPRFWDDAKREAVRAKWRKKLEPVFRLPQGWSEYLQEPDLLCIHQEKPSDMAATFANHVRMPCRNAAGALLEKPLDEYINDWLATPEQQVLFLLGEFGDGKSFFTYALARQLTANWSPRSGTNWMPLRLALRTFPGNARDFLRNRLETFNATVSGWENIGKVSRRLVILDGFDEMSVDLDPATITKNIKALLSCLDEFNDCKVLVASRTHFFHNRKDAQRLLTRTGSAPIYYLAPIGRSQVVGNVAGSVADKDRQELLRQLETMNDPIGLASKPLFLEMLKQVLGAKDLPADLDIVNLYERYIDLSLNRKQDLLDDPDLSLPRGEIIRNLKKLLGRIAIQLQRSGNDYVLLRELVAEFREPFAKLLWNLSGVDTLSEDAQSRVGARSLLGRVLRPGLEEEWPVDFCHRSMREYFVAVQLCEAVENGVERGAKFLQEVPLNHEILEFAAERWRKSHNALVKENLLEIIKRAVPSNDPRLMGGYALTLLYRLEAHLPREFSWEEKVFDGADLENADLSRLNFRGSSFRDSNLANVNFEQANFEKCDLSNVRIEETTPVLALATEPSCEHIVAAYRDGVLRQWHLKPGRRTPSKVLGKLTPMSGCMVGVHESGQLWLNSGREWTFLTSANDKTWTYSGRFNIKKEFHAVRFQPPFLVLTESDEKDLLHVVSVHLEHRTKLRLIQTNASRHFATLGMKAVIWSDAEVGFRIAQAAVADSRTDLILACDEPTCLDIFLLSEDTYLIAGGTGNGVVHAWKVSTRDSVLTSEKILESRVHEGVVTAVAFVDGSRLSSGGSDCAIVISRWSQNGDLNRKVERRLQLKLRCRGLRIEGLRGEKEFGLLTRLIQEADARDEV